jgi:hypothetical protein
MGCRIRREWREVWLKINATLSNLSFAYKMSLLGDGCVFIRHLNSLNGVEGRKRRSTRASGSSMKSARHSLANLDGKVAASFRWRRNAN